MMSAIFIGLNTVFYSQFQVTKGGNPHTIQETEFINLDRIHSFKKIEPEAPYLENPSRSIVYVIKAKGELDRLQVLQTVEDIQEKIQKEYYKLKTLRPC